MGAAASAPVLLYPVLDTDPVGYNEVVAGRRVADEVAGPTTFDRHVAQFRRCIEVFREATDGRGGITVHSSPFFRWTFLHDPFLDLWKEVARMGFDLVLHAHEDRRGGGTYFEDRARLERVIPKTADALRAAGLRVEVFRSGYCAFSNALTAVLEAAGVRLDLSAAPGIYNSSRDVDWRGGPDTAQRLDRLDFRATPPAVPSPVITVPIGWDGTGNTYAGHYLFNEVNTGDDLARVIDAIRARAERREMTQVVLFLCHTYGLDDPCQAEQARQFLCRERAALVGSHEILALPDESPVR